MLAAIAMPFCFALFLLLHDGLDPAHGEAEGLRSVLPWVERPDPPSPPVATLAPALRSPIRATSDSGVRAVSTSASVRQFEGSTLSNESAAPLILTATGALDLPCTEKEKRLRKPCCAVLAPA